MLRLRSSILTRLLSTSSVAFPSNPSIHRLLSATAAPRIFPNPSFAVEDYLVDACGLTRTQALKASAKLSHLKCPSNPDAVLAFLAGLGLSRANLAVLVARDPTFLSTRVDAILAANAAELAGLGLSRPEVARLVSLAGGEFLRASVASRVRYYLPLLGSCENLFRALKQGSHLLCADLELVVKPNVAFLRECGLSDCDIAQLCINFPRMMTTDPQSLQAVVACAEGLGVPRGSGMFRQVLQVVSNYSKEKIASKVEELKNTFGWSDAEVGIAVRKAPRVLRRSKQSLQRRFDFLVSELGFEPAYIARHPLFVIYSPEGRIRPRYSVVKFLKENGLPHRNWSYNVLVKESEMWFVEKFIRPHKEAAPHLAEDYAARFIFARTMDPSFAIEDYLVNTCGLTRAQALRASPKLSHLHSPSNPDAVLAFLAGLGLSSADVATLVARDPKLLCVKVDTTLASNVAELTGLGLSHPEIARLVSLVGSEFRHRSIVSKLQYCLPLFGSPGILLRVLERGSYLLNGTDFDKVVKPNVVFLRECGLSDCKIAKICIPMPRLLNTKPERLRAMVACAEGIGVPRGSGMFRQALQAVAFLSEETIAAKVDYLQKTFRWSDAEVNLAVSKAPFVLKRSKGTLQLRSDFLISEVGLEPAYIACFPTLILYSLEGRIRPRHYVVKFLKENGLLDRKRSYNSIFAVSEKGFVEMFICPHKETAPHLAEDYDAACRGEVPARLLIAPRICSGSV